MIVDHDEDGPVRATYIWIDGALPPDFERRLLGELLALSEPVGLGAVVANIRKRENMDAILDEGMRLASHDHRGRRHRERRLLLRLCLRPSH